MLTSVLIGANRARAAGHLRAYERVRGATLAAVSARTPGVAGAVAAQYRIPRHFDDHRDMLAAIAPDIVHLNTPPNARIELLRDCERAGVSGVIVEKPVGVDGRDYDELVAFEAATPMKVIVNHQLHFHPRRQILAELVEGGAIGPIRLIDASAGDTAAYQGTHTIQAAMAFAHSPAIRVLGQVSGGEGLRPNPAEHLAPDYALGTFDLASGATILFRCGQNAPRVDDVRAEKKFHHKRIRVYGERGAVEWTMWGWSVLVDGSVAAGSHDYRLEDLIGQASLVDSLVEWLSKPSADHPLSLRRALDEFNMLLGLYMSALDREPVSLLGDPRLCLMEELRTALVRPLPTQRKP